MVMKGTRKGGKERERIEKERKGIELIGKGKNIELCRQIEEKKERRRYMR